MYLLRFKQKRCFYRVHIVSIQITYNKFIWLFFIQNCLRFHKSIYDSFQCCGNLPFFIKHNLLTIKIRIIKVFQGLNVLTYQVTSPKLFQCKIYSLKLTTDVVHWQLFCWGLTVLDHVMQQCHLVVPLCSCNPSVNCNESVSSSTQHFQMNTLPCSSSGFSQNMLFLMSKYKVTICNLLHENTTFAWVPLVVKQQIFLSLAIWNYICQGRR